jgi:hypothetical protein
MTAASVTDVVVMNMTCAIEDSGKSHEEVARETNMSPEQLDRLLSGRGFMRVEDVARVFETLYGGVIGLHEWFRESEDATA